MTIREVFNYPSEPLQRKHEPAGYKNYQSYKPWLRDEFSFRCIYCLSRESWNPEGHSAFSCDHVIAQTNAPELILDYNNLVYSCCNCNSCRQHLPLPSNPCDDPMGCHLEIDEEGVVKNLSSIGKDYIDLCQLNRPTLVNFRKRVLRILNLMEQGLTPELMEIATEYFKLPDQLPNLSKLKPVDNRKPEGVAQSYFEKSIRD